MMKGTPFYIAYLAPIVIIIVINLVILFLAYRSLSEESRLQKSSHMEKITKVRIAASLSVLLGTTWIFGLFAVGKLTLTFQIIFCLFNSLQGLFIFIFYCARNTDAQNEWKQCVLRLAERYRRRWQFSPSEHSASGPDVCLKSYTKNSTAFLSEIPIIISSSDNQIPLRESMPSYPTDAISSIQYESGWCRGNSFYDHSNIKS